ncbi:phage holin family protein [Marinoscillum sp. MHG1-6]|uniref:phage holin family protein n=1 Tax=Marinoscillum sp. MHG1-6 TaxID=2959627 RepID=UPI002157CF9B|nr:phage holin family protein [Marinoscillum sp. MHG1-6]
MNFLVKLFLSSLAVILTSYLLPGVYVDSFLAALIVALFLSLLNVTIKPLLIILTIPLTVFTLGLFLLVINALIILIADSFVSGFAVNGFWWALLFSLILSLINSIIAELSGSDQK